MQEALIREAKVDDAKSILKVRQLSEEHSLAFPLTEEMLQEALLHSCVGFVAEVDDELIGFSMVNRYRGEVWGIFVIESFQNMGVGRTLLGLAVDWLKSDRKYLFIKRHKKIYLTTMPGSRAEEFYLKQGWEKGDTNENGEVLYWYTF